MVSEGYLQNRKGARIPMVLYSVFTIGCKIKKVMTIFEGSGEVKWTLG